jgi:DNA-binding transcriptional regulator YiaG
MTLQAHIFETVRADTIAAATGFGVIRERLPPLSVIVVSGALSVSGTSSAEPTRLWNAPYVHASGATAGGLGREQHASTTDGAETTRQAISELRRLSGLTWEQLGELFDVSRRSVHFWASGKPLNADNEQRLMRMLDVVRAANRGDARSTRAALFEVNEGTTAFALLTEGRFEEAHAILGVGASRPRPALGALSADAKEARTTLPPETLIEALHDRVGRDPGRARAARTARNKQRGTS